MKTKTLLLVISTIEFALIGSSLAKEGYVAHEWGTFTSVQGGDGVPLEWNPLTSSELPGFVHDWSKPLGEPRRHLTGFLGKTAFRTLQRMETPVIYFYADSAQTVDVTTRTMAVELDVQNTDGRLSPGTFCQVRWPVRRTGPSSTPRRRGPARAARPSRRSRPKEERRSCVLSSLRRLHGWQSSV